jgi:acyl-CoA synthetase (AMP-forming)/AMP-acid ligase II
LIPRVVNPFNDTIPDELHELLSLSKPTIVLCSKSSLGNVVKVKDKLGFINTVISFDGVVESNQTILSYADLIKESEGFQIEEDVDLENQVGLILNSSGTSGLPKGVMVTQKMLWLNFVQSR